MLENNSRPSRLLISTNSRTDGRTKICSERSQILHETFPNLIKRATLSYVWSGPKFFSIYDGNALRLSPSASIGVPGGLARRAKPPGHRSRPRAKAGGRCRHRSKKISTHNTTGPIVHLYSELLSISLYISVRLRAGISGKIPDLQNSTVGARNSKIKFFAILGLL